MKIFLPESEVEFARALQDAAEVGSIQTLVSMGVLQPFMSLTEAQNSYGKGRVKFWLRSGLIDKQRDGDGNAKCRIDRVQILTVAKAQNRVEWLAQKNNN